MVSKTEGKPPEPGDALRWSVEQRLAFIEERLFWLGSINRTDLVRRFGVSMSQASADIGRYLALGPPGLDYDKSGKRYVADENTFRLVLGKPDAGRLLGELRLVDLGILTETETLTGEAPPFDVTPVPSRSIDAYVLRAVVLAIREHRALVATYQSMNRPEPTRRRLEPHALAHDGFRWHARAFDAETGSFRDFVLGRLAKAKLDGPATSIAGNDRDWTTFIDLKIAPHPGLTAAQARAISLDYGLRGGSGTVRVRRALVFYALRQLGLDVAADARPAQEQHIVLTNREEVEAALARRGEP
jgi:hypothetical protein